MPDINVTEDLSAARLAGYDRIIDVRSPAEFAEDHIPGAINLPVLDDEERARVGTIYVQDSRFKARRLGAALVSKNIGEHLQDQLASMPADFFPLVYCWRGGMRSNAMATVLSAVGWRVDVIDGGYKSWRRTVVSSLRQDCVPLKLILLDGQTGTAKTAILGRLAGLGVQTIDLEGLANHRGSVFGAAADSDQPSQKFFESQLWNRLSSLDATRHIVVEAESNRIGRRGLPERFVGAMRAAARIEVAAPLKARAEYLTTAYADIIASEDRLLLALEALRPFHPKKTIEGWLELASVGQMSDLAGSIAEQHYDPLYSKYRKRSGRAALATIEVAELKDDNLDQAARKIRDMVARLDDRA